MIAGSLAPVGYAIDGKDVLLLDDQGRIRSDAGEGEILVRSRYLSAGYWRNPELTRTAFTFDLDDPELRTFRTGDLGRLHPDGCLECLGRLDSQVKIRGYRIETEEVEAAQSACAGIREAVVVAEAHDGEARLIAYLVPAVHPAPNPGTLRRMLAGRLPDFMIPSVFVALDALPRLPNGKLNRRGLPKAEIVRPEIGVPFAEPRTAVEKDIARIWAELLGVDRVGVDDNFLDLGGDSVVVMRVISRVRDRFGVALAVPDLWKAATVAEISNIVAARLSSNQPQKEGRS